MRMLIACSTLSVCLIASSANAMSRNVLVKLMVSGAGGITAATIAKKATKSWAPHQPVPAAPQHQAPSNSGSQQKALAWWQTRPVLPRS